MELNVTGFTFELEWAALESGVMMTSRPSGVKRRWAFLQLAQRWVGDGRYSSSSEKTTTSNPIAFKHRTRRRSSKKHR